MTEGRSSVSLRDGIDTQPSLVIANARIFDGSSSDLTEGHILIGHDRILSISRHAAPPANIRCIDVGGRFVMPGLIDAHIHAYVADLNIYKSDRLPITLIAQRAHVMLSRMLARGFTTVRDVGGADYGLAQAITAGWLRGPRLFYCGKALSQTGGHGDMRSPSDDLCLCGHGHTEHGYVGHLTRTVDGVDAARIAVRENFRQGASFIKIMGSGGASSVADALNSAQYAEEEIVAIVDEAERHGAYVTAHCHPDQAIRRCVKLGVHCIEHGTMLTDETAQLLARKGVAVVPTLSVIRALQNEGPRLGYPRESLQKLAQFAPLAMASVEKIQRAGVTIGFGTDLLGELETQQCLEFQVRAEIQQPIDVLRSATSLNARILRVEDSIGQIAPGFLADIIAVDGNPLEDLSVFNSEGSSVPLVVKAGDVVKSNLS
jgi:imidazolonepropionase-like amidohydrolase